MKEFTSSWLLYFAFARISFRKQFAYRIANWAGLFTNIFFLFFRASVFEAIYPANKIVGNFSQMDALTYVCLTQALIMVVPQWGLLGVEEEIRSGQIATTLARPANYFLSVAMQRMGTSYYYLIHRAAPILAVAFAVEFLKAPANLLDASFFLLSGLLGAWIAVCLHFLTEAAAFWLESSRGPKMLLIGVLNFFSGMVLPLNFFPPLARQISSWLPFEYTLNAPAQIYLGKSDAPLLLAKQCLWAISLFAICQFCLLRGERKVSLNGG